MATDIHLDQQGVSSHLSPLKIAEKQLVRTAVPNLVCTCGGELQVQLLQQLVFSIGLDYLLARVWTI